MREPNHTDSASLGRVNVTVNGRAHSVVDGSRLVEFLQEQGVDPRRIAVERNREVVPRDDHADLKFADGDVYEIVHFVGGG